MYQTQLQLRLATGTIPNLILMLNKSFFLSFLRHYISLPSRSCCAMQHSICRDRKTSLHANPWVKTKEKKMLQIATMTVQQKFVIILLNFS